MTERLNLTPEARESLAKLTGTLNAGLAGIVADVERRPQRSRTAERTMGLRPQEKITTRERTVIDALRWLTYQNGWTRADKVGERTGQSPQGAATVLNSCVRKGLARRRTGRGHVWFGLTGKGWKLARPRTEQARRAAR